VVAGAPDATLMRARLGTLVAIVRVIAFPASIVLVAVMAVRAAGDVHADRLDWGLLAAAAVPALVWWLLLARAWGLVHNGRARRADLRTWCRTQALRYLPGGIWAPVSRAAAVEGHALDRVATVAAENVVALCAALAVGGLALGAGGDLAWLPLVLVAAAPAAVAGHVGRHSRVDRERTIAATLNDLVAFAAYAAAGVLVQAAVSGWHEPLAVAGAAALAWAVGLVVIVTPGGVGVREVVYVWLLERHGFGHSELVAAAVAFRLITILVELAVLVALGHGPLSAGPQSSSGAGTGTVASESALRGRQPGVEVRIADPRSRR
jgi:hypothetical protein